MDVRWNKLNQWCVLTLSQLDKSFAITEIWILIGKVCNEKRENSKIYYPVSPMRSKGSLNCIPLPAKIASRFMFLVQTMCLNSSYVDDNILKIIK